MIKKFFISTIVGVFILFPYVSHALEMPSAQNMAEQTSFSAKAYIVLDMSNGSTLIGKNADLPWTAASLTKLVTALVFLDTKPNLKKIVTMNKTDEVGGARIATKAGVSYRLNDLLHSSLIASTNNTTHALVRSTGLSEEDFIKRMNDKVKELGATQSTFYEVTGMDPRNTVTAVDYAKIVSAAFANPMISKIAKLPKYSFTSTNNKKYRHSIKNTDKLLQDTDFVVLGGKTGYLEESLYNFATQLKDKFENNFVIVLLGSSSPTTQFKEVRELAYLAGAFKSFGGTPAMVLGTSTVNSVSNQ